MKRLLAIGLLIVSMGCSFCPRRQADLVYLRLEPDVSEVKSLPAYCLWQVDASQALRERRMVYKKGVFYHKYASHFWYSPPPRMLEEALLDAFSFAYSCDNAKRLYVHLEDLEPIFGKNGNYLFFRVRVFVYGRHHEKLAEHTFSYQSPLKGIDFEKIKLGFDRLMSKFISDLYGWLSSR